MWFSAIVLVDTDDPSDAIRDAYYACSELASDNIFDYASFDRDWLRDTLETLEGKFTNMCRMDTFKCLSDMALEGLRFIIDSETGDYHDCMGKKTETKLKWLRMWFEGFKDKGRNPYLIMAGVYYDSCVVYYDSRIKEDTNGTL